MEASKYPLQIKATGFEEEKKRSRNVVEQEESGQPSPFQSDLQRKLSMWLRDPLFQKCITLIPNDYITKPKPESKSLKGTSEKSENKCQRWRKRTGNVVGR